VDDLGPVVDEAEQAARARRCERQQAESAEVTKEDVCTGHHEQYEDASHSGGSLLDEMTLRPVRANLLTDAPESQQTDPERQQHDRRDDSDDDGDEYLI
jgi:hypothetical protein